MFHAQRVTEAWHREEEKFVAYRKLMDVLMQSDARGIRIKELEQKTQAAQQEWLEAIREYVRIFWEERGMPCDRKEEGAV